MNKNVIQYNHHIRSTDEVTDANTGMAYSATFYKMHMSKLYPRNVDVDYHFQYKSFDNKYVSLTNIYMYFKIVSYFVTVVFKLCYMEPLLSAEDFQGLHKSIYFIMKFKNIILIF